MSGLKALVDEIVKHTDIVDVVSEYVSLERKGRNYFGLCPFHEEKTPSFSVSPEKQIFHCFSCGVGGNVVKFIENIEHIPYREAVLRLANRLNINIRQYIGHNNNQDQIKYFEINRFVAEYYQFVLTNTKEGEAARHYLYERGIDDELIQRFQIGLAPNSRDSLYQALKANGFTELLMLEAGHVSKHDDRYYDRFKNRIMFPIKDEEGNIVGFSGRSFLPDHEDSAKYVNTQETPVFKKSLILYNLSDAIQAIRENRSVILHEGFMDVIASVKSGIHHAVATMGTALTREHILRLKRYTKHVVIIYDGDEAGIEATMRAMELLRQEYMTVSVVTLPEKLDPDDFVQKYGPMAYREYIEQKQISDKEYLYQHYYKEVNPNQVRSVERFKRRVFQLLLNSSRVEQELFLQKMHHDLRISLDTLKIDLEGFQRYRRNAARNQRLITDADRGSQDRLVATVNYKTPNPSKHQRAERDILFHMMKDRKYSSLFNQDKGVVLQNKLYHELNHFLYGYYSLYDTFDRTTFIEYIKRQASEEKLSAYLSCFDELWDQYNQVLIENYNDQTYVQCVNVLKSYIIRDHVNKMNKLLQSTVDEKERMRIAESIMNNIKLIKSK
ncbi:MAG TPA: DNA primase [Haloplasmataceae bacterium]